ncbi:alpha-ketoglutarate decarboxylase [Capnocytophaga sp. ARDL2]|uniref:alpha-ketoglutarate decarboxylase n=1 Tax=Capnocytophaga sp. ARDL2 TaxID=3238809 RepID=UPI0035566821
MKKIITLALGIMFSTYAVAQEYETPQVSPVKSFFSDVQFGGDIGFGFGSNNRTSIIVAPKAVKPINQYVRAGLGVHYGYHSFGNHSKASIYGGSAIVIGNPIPQIQLMTELEQLRINSTVTNIYNVKSENNFWNTALFIGAGYNMGSVTMGIKYNVLHNSNSIYVNAWNPFLQVFF